LLRPSLPVRLAQFKSPLLGAIKPINNCANVLSTAGLTHDPQGFARSYLKINAIEGVSKASRPTQPVVTDGETHTNIVELKNREGTTATMKDSIVHHESSLTGNQQALYVGR
jgi:hypothetical protein